MNRNLSEAMFHGTKAVIKDNLIKPGSTGMAYATSDPSAAKMFGDTKLPEGEVGKNKVYKVMPLSDDVIAKKGNLENETHYASPTGFLVLGEHSE
jgi:hypothetical protein